MYRAALVGLIWLGAVIFRPLFAQGPAFLQDFNVYPGLSYAKVGGSDLLLDLYVPKSAARPVPVILWIHGGGWSAGNRNDAFGYPFLKSGFAVASIDYRLSQVAVFPAQLYDCKAAVRWLRAHAADYGLNPDKMAAAGASAGGHLAALLGTTANRPELEGNEGNPGVSSRVQAVCDFYGPADFLNWVVDGHALTSDPAGNAIDRLIGGPVTENQDKARAASPIYYVTPSASPFYIAHGDHDALVPLSQSVQLCDALQKAGVPVTLYVVKGAGHAFHDRTAYDHAIAFLKHWL